MLVPGLVIFFPVVRGSGTVRVCSEFVEFGSSLVRVIWHGVFYPRFSIPGFRSTLESLRFPSCSITDVSGEMPAWRRGFFRPIAEAYWTE